MEAERHPLSCAGIDYEVSHHGIITSFSQVPESDGIGMLSYLLRIHHGAPLQGPWTIVSQSRIFQA